MHGGNGLKFCMLMFLDHLQNWLDFGRALRAGYGASCVCRNPIVMLQSPQYCTDYHCHRECTDCRRYILGAVKLCLDWIFKGFFTLRIACGTGLIESFNNNKNNNDISKGFVMFNRDTCFFIKVFSCHSYCRTWKLLGLSQLVHWLKPIKVSDL